MIWPADARWLWRRSMAAIQGSESAAPDPETPEGRPVFQGWGGFETRSGDDGEPE